MKDEDKQRVSNVPRWRQKSRNSGRKHHNTLPSANDTATDTAAAYSSTEKSRSLSADDKSSYRHADSRHRQGRRSNKSRGKDKTAVVAAVGQSFVVSNGTSEERRQQLKKDVSSSRSDEKVQTTKRPAQRQRGPRRRNNNGGSSNNNSSSNPKLRKQSSSIVGQQDDNMPYPSHWNLEDCLALYAQKDPLLIRGKLRVLPAKDGKAFVTCDRGRFVRDVLIESPFEQNRALDGDVVFVELSPPNEAEEEACVTSVTKTLDKVTLVQPPQEEVEEQDEPVLGTWQEDDIQRRLWNPQVAIPKPRPSRQANVMKKEESQRRGRVVHVMMPNQMAGTQPSELRPSDESYLHRAPRRTFVGRLNRMRRTNGNDTLFLQPNNRSLPQFICPNDFSVPPSQEGEDATLYRAEYVYGSWRESSPKPPCINVQKMGMSCNVQDETLALLLEYDVNHGDFSAPVLKDVEEAVQSGMELGPSSSSSSAQHSMEWRPTPDMYKGRRDFTKERIFTIDPTTAKDLDDALHVKALLDGRVEIGVHIADVSYFVQPDTAVDAEAARRATTVYLVDRTVPMLPPPLCEIACSLNENVERLAFSCVWRMNMDGSVEGQNEKHNDDVWYGRSVIKSCARLDYATAQNIIEGKVATGERAEDMDEELWPSSRRPSGNHTVEQVAGDVRLMNRVAQARRRLRFQNGALALNGIKLAFQLDQDGETPLLCAPYPLRDSNRLVEEYMLLANYFVAQRLITHAVGLALLRNHPPPLTNGLEQVVQVARESTGFEIDPTSSHALQASLSRLGRECDDELVIQCVTEMLMTPMKPAEYMAAGTMEPELWRHFALNIPFYTHFTSPIRRYADVIVHRLLQATLDGEDAVDSFPMNVSDVQAVSTHCNTKKMASKKAQDRSDRVFLALYVRRNPLRQQLGVVLSVGEKTFTVFVPSLGASILLFLDEHRDILTFEPYSMDANSERRIRLVRKTTSRGGATANTSNWTSIDIKVFTKVSVSCHCKEKPPIDVKLKLEGPWNPPLPENGRWQRRNREVSE